MDPMRILYEMVKRLIEKPINDGPFTVTFGGGYVMRGNSIQIEGTDGRKFKFTVEEIED